MKYSIYIVVAFCFTFLASCTKEDSTVERDGMVKTVDSIAMDPEIGLMPMDDGTYVVVSNGQLVKLNSRGIIMWRKPITEISDTRASVVEPGKGFVLLGVPANPPTPSCYYACRYDTDGNLLDTKQVNTNFTLDFQKLRVSVINLANGGFAIAMSCVFTWCTYVKILDHDFNLIYSKVLTHPVLPDEYYTFLVQDMCEMPNGDLALVATADYGDNFTMVRWISAGFVLMGPDGTVKSLTLHGDSVTNQIAHAVSPYTGGFFTATSTKTGGWFSNNGTFVNYYNGTQIAGTMQIDQFNSQGQYAGSRLLTGYTGYGVIKSIRKTSDGGFLLCGTVNNNGSSVSVSMTKMFACKLDANLNEVWSTMFNSTYQAIGSDAVPTSDGGYLVAGNLKSFGDDYQMLIIQTDANGHY